MPPTSSSTWRVIVGFLLAPLVPSLGVSAFAAVAAGRWSGVLDLAGLIAVIGGYPAALIFGVPAYLFLRSRVQPSLHVVVPVAGLVAALPWMMLSYSPLTVYSSDSGGVLVADGVRTAYGHVRNLQLFGLLFALGGVGGLVFWLCLNLRPRSLRDAD